MTYEIRTYETEKERQERMLEHLLETPEQTFQQRLFQLIDASGMDYITFYKSANMDRKLFSQIKMNKDCRPKKRTILAMAFALKLDLQNTQDLLARAGYAFSPVDTLDRIIRFFLENHNYNLEQVNKMLRRYNEPEFEGSYK